MNVTRNEVKKQILRINHVTEVSELETYTAAAFERIVDLVHEHALASTLSFEEYFDVPPSPSPYERDNMLV